MIYVTTALFCEAKPWIQTYSLKRDPAQKKFQIFQNDNIRLIITQTGKVNAAIAVTELFHHTPPKPTDVLINAGIAASCKPERTLGGGYLVHKITDHDTLRDYYPDVIYRHTFPEASLATYSHAASTAECQSERCQLIDMEASGIYAAATNYLEAHQIIFFKCISDAGSFEHLTPDLIAGFLLPYIAPLYDYGCQIADALSRESNPVLTKKDEHCIVELSEAMHFSVTMQYQFRQLIYYAKLTGADIASYLNELQQGLQLQPCHSKKEGKIYLERIRNELL